MHANSISQDEHFRPRAHAHAGGPNLIASFKNDIIGQSTTSFATSTNAIHGDEASAHTVTTALYHGNQQYSVTALSDSSGNVSERYAYTAYGQPTFLNASGVVQTSSAASNRYNYTGREWDSTLGLYHFRARWMSGVSGRLLTRDPIGYEGSPWNLYELMEGMTLSYGDPHGLSIPAPNAIFYECTICFYQWTGNVEFSYADADEDTCYANFPMDPTCFKYFVIKDFAGTVLESGPQFRLPPRGAPISHMREVDLAYCQCPIWIEHRPLTPHNINQGNPQCGNGRLINWRP